MLLSEKANFTTASLNSELKQKIKNKKKKNSYYKKEE